MLIDIEIVAILVEQLHTDRHVLVAKVFIDFVEQLRLRMAIAHATGAVALRVILPRFKRDADHRMLVQVQWFKRSELSVLVNGVVPFPCPYSGVQAEYL